MKFVLNFYVWFSWADEVLKVKQSIEKQRTNHYSSMLGDMTSLQLASNSHWVTNIVTNVLISQEPRTGI